MTVKVLESLRTEANFTLSWSNVKLKSRNLDVMEPSLSRKHKRPVRYEVGNTEAEFYIYTQRYLKYVRNLEQVQRDLLSDICTVIKLTLVTPTTNAVSER